METTTHQIAGGQVAAAPPLPIELMQLLERSRSEGQDRRSTRIMPLREFRSLLQKEIRRSDRTQQTMTFVTFGLSASFPQGRLVRQALDRLAAIVPSLTRGEDIVGWFRSGKGRKQLGAILHRTEPEKARRVLHAVRERYLDAMNRAAGETAGVPELICDVYAYPWPSRLEGKGDGCAELEYGDAPATEAAPGRNGTGRLRSREASGIAAISPAGGFMVHPHPGWKRFIDFFGSVFLIAVLSPLFFAVALAVKLTSPGPVFFKQDRVGQNGRLYKFWKFRSMAHNYDTTAHQEHLKTLIRSGAGDVDDGVAMKKLDSTNSQITKVGRLIRKTSIDELPQLFNVLRGEMSLVGPRPCVPYEAAEYLHWHTRRFDSVPGMTGLWQVKGKNRTTFKEMIRLDIHYGLHQSLLFDLKIFLLTIPAIIRDARAA